MATKGVLFSSLVDPGASSIDYCIDINPNKQDCFVPVTAQPISSPSALRVAGGNPLVVAVMNDHYREEIEATCRSMGLHATLFSPQSASAVETWS